MTDWIPNLGYGASMSKTKVNLLLSLLVALTGGLAYTIFLLTQPTVIANEIVWAPNSTDTKYHRLFFSDGTVMRREKYQEYDWTPWREDEDYPKPPKGR